MALKEYFTSLIERLESSDEIQNDGKDKSGFYVPTRAVLLKQLNVLRDLHANERARPMVQGAWSYVVDHLPPDWLILSPEDKAELQKILQAK